jgi:hypothetical protein
LNTSHHALGLDQCEEAFAAAGKMSYMRPESDFEPTIMLIGRTIGYFSNSEGPNCRTERRAIDNRSGVLDGTSYAATVALFVVRFLFNCRGVSWRSEFSLSIRKHVKVTIPVRPWLPKSAAAKAVRMNDEAHTLSRTDGRGDQRKILDAAGGET